MPALYQALLFGLLASGFAAAKTAGCGKSLEAGKTPNGASTNETHAMANGVKRTYLLYIPSTYDINKPAPVIFSFHGRGDSAAGQEGTSQFSKKSVNPNAIAVYPQGLKSAWQGAPYASSNADDTGLVAGIISDLSNKYCVDRDRIYASGQSNGGGFTGTLACDPTTSKLIAAFGAHSGAFYPGSTSTSATCDADTVTIPCNPGRKSIPILEIHGDADGQIPYTGGLHESQCLPSISHWVTAWAARDGYSTVNSTTVLANGAVTKYEFGGGAVTHYKVKGLGHGWPNSGLGDANWKSSPVMIDFFNQWTLAGRSSTYSPVAVIGTSASSSVRSSTPSKTSTSSSKSSTSSTLKVYTTSSTKPSTISTKPSTSSSIKAYTNSSLKSSTNDSKKAATSSSPKGYSTSSSVKLPTTLPKSSSSIKPITSSLKAYTSISSKPSTFTKPSASSTPKVSTSTSIKPTTKSSATSIKPSSSQKPYTTSTTKPSSTLKTTPSPTPSLLCPISASKTLTVAGKPYTIECGADRGGNDMPAPNGVHAASLAHCIARCAARSGCVAVAQVTGNGACYLKSKVGTAKANRGVNGAYVAGAVAAEYAYVGNRNYV